MSTIIIVIVTTYTMYSIIKAYKISSLEVTLFLRLIAY